MDGTLVGGDDGLEVDVCENEVAVGEEIREVDIPDDVDVEGEGGVSRLEGTGMLEVNDGTGEPNEPDMSSILDGKTR